MPKKRSRRSNSKYPGLIPELNLKTRSDLLDQDYLHKLNDKELHWMNQFNDEYVNDVVDRDNPENNLNSIKDCDDRNNARNRDILTRAKASNQLMDYEELYEETDSNNYEDEIIEELDKQDIRESIDWLANNLERDEMKLEKTLINEQNNVSERNMAKSLQPQPPKSPKPYKS